MTDLFKDIFLGPCAKATVTCTLVHPDGRRWVGQNVCRNAQESCPRLPGEGYEKCRSICDQVGHAEVHALMLAGANAKDAAAFIEGHTYACMDCQHKLFGAGVKSISIGEPPRQEQRTGAGSMTTTHTQPAGCDLDSLRALIANDGFAMSFQSMGQYRTALIAAARAAQAPQGDTRQGAPDEEIAPYELKRLHKLLSIAGVAGPETLDAAASMACFWALIGEITNKLSATPAAHTCAPADERTLWPGYECQRRDGEGRLLAWEPLNVESDAEAMRLMCNGEIVEWRSASRGAFEKAMSARLSAEQIYQGALTWAWDSKGYKDPQTQSKWMGWELARAAQGAGTAPVQVQTDAWGVEYLPDTKWVQDHDGRVELMSRQNAENICINKNYRAVPLRVEIYRAATHPAPVSTAAATTASASTLTDQRILEIFNECGDGISTVGFARAIEREVIAPSRAADGQHGASSAALDEDSALIVATGVSDDAIQVIVSAKQGDVTTVLYSRRHSLNGDSIGTAALARAQLPAQADGQAVDDAQGYSVGDQMDATQRLEQHVNNLWTNGDVDHGAAQSRAQSDTTGDHNA